MYWLYFPLFFTICANCYSHVTEGKLANPSLDTANKYQTSPLPQQPTRIVGLDKEPELSSNHGNRFDDRDISGMRGNQGNIVNDIDMNGTHGNVSSDVDISCNHSNPVYGDQCGLTPTLALPDHTPLSPHPETDVGYLDTLMSTYLPDVTTSMTSDLIDDLSDDVRPHSGETSLSTSGSMVAEGMSLYMGYNGDTDTQLMSL